MNEEIAKMLLVEDNPADAHLLRTMVEGTRWGPVEVTHVDRMGAAEEHLKARPTDVVLLDLGLPDARGLGAVRRGLAAARGVPLLVLTGLDDGAMAAKALQEGAQDYLIKGEIDGNSLMRAIRYTMLRQRMQVEAAQAHEKQLALKDEFLSHVSHELRSPLAAIDQFTTILQDGLAGDLTARQGEYVGIILRNVRQLGSMIDDLLEITRAQVGKLTLEPQRMCASDAIADVAGTLAAAAAVKQITLTAAVPARLPAVHADPQRVRQILLNLIGNAIKFTPCGGRIAIDAGRWAEDPDYLRVRVTDTGCGMSPEATELVFDRLYQVEGASDASRKGLGLGLYISRELAVRQGGRIWVESEMGKGSAFSFTIPVFSLATLIGPLLDRAKHPSATLALLAIELAAPDQGVAAERWDEAAREAYRVVQRCVLPDLDVLLPRMTVGPGREAQFIVAMVDESGAGVLARRLREQLGGCEALAATAVSSTVRVQMMDLEPRDDSASAELYASAVAVRIEELLEAATLTEKAA